MSLSVDHSTITAHFDLPQGIHLSSPNQTYHLCMQADGNLVLYQGHVWRSDTAVWSSGTFNRGVGPFRLSMQSDGNLVIYDGRNTPTWTSNTQHRGFGPHRLVVQNDRNVVIYDAGNHPTWATNTNV